MSTDRIQLVVLGGFLGAGKTTLLKLLAKHFETRGFNVGVITNDQSSNLVDTSHLRSHGLRVSEISGGTFSTHFHSVLNSIKGMNDASAVNLVIAEPSGGSVDLVATVLEPVRVNHADLIRVSPLVVVVNPASVLQIFKHAPNSQSSGSGYIILKQIEEADVVLLNRVDELSAGLHEEVLQLLSDRFPGKAVFSISQDEANLEEIVETLLTERDVASHPIDVNYQTYAQSEAQLGWLNAHFRFHSHHDFYMDDLILGIAMTLQKQLKEAAIDGVHFKLVGQSDDDFAIANLGGPLGVNLTVSSGADTDKADVILNLRAISPPEKLQSLLDQTVQEVTQLLQLKVNVREVECFSPVRSTPSYRIPPLAGE